MKTMKHIRLKISAFMAFAIACILPGHAQTSENFYSNIDWQFNFPISNSFAQRGSGW